MKYKGFKEVNSICYPNDYVIIKRKSGILNFIILNLIICLMAALGIVAIKFFGAEDILNVINDTLSKGTSL